MLGEKTPAEKVSLVPGYSREERVQDTAPPEELDPPPPGSLGLGVRSLLLRVQDSSMVASTCETKKKASSGSGEILKDSGMTCDMKE
jgi:hypothetical protein